MNIYIMGLAIKYDQNEFIRRSNKIHGNKYDYSLVNYKNSRDKIKIICSKISNGSMSSNDIWTDQIILKINYSEA